ncbi:WAT1-related protein At3g30340-like [Actinidia eriantha]|uniref:WAT1-related protein At3g30340-like n=1 Tax=Actinidia eriantha TaxID=165200 RepID=UPI00258E2DB6|nr:WAT1-related protein At3g30340-like [Actinidia eriantha]
MDCCEQWKPFIAMVAVDFALAVVNILLKKVLNEGLSHLLIITYRQSISAIFLAPVAYFWERKGRPRLTVLILCHLFFSALVGATLTQYFFLLGLQYTSATFTCSFINMVPVNTFIMALPFGLEKVNMKNKGGRAKILGMLVSVGGALILTLYKGIPLTKSPSAQAIVHKRHHGNKRWAIGSIVLTAGSIMWSSWFLMQAKIGKRYPCQYSSTALMSFFSAVQSAILLLITDWNVSKWTIKGKFEITTVVYAGIVGSGLCYVVMSWCVKQRGPVFTAAFSPFIQAFVAVFDISILHEEVHLGSVLGSTLVVAGMYILLWGKSNEAEDCVTKHLPITREDEDCSQLSHVIRVPSNLNST